MPTPDGPVTIEIPAGTQPGQRFRLRKREPRKGRNPKTGDKVDVPPKKVPYFKPGKELKELINREAEAAESALATDIAGAAQSA